MPFFPWFKPLLSFPKSILSEAPDSSSLTEVIWRCLSCPGFKNLNCFLDSFFHHNDKYLFSFLPWPELHFRVTGEHRAESNTDLSLQDATWEPRGLWEILQCERDWDVPTAVAAAAKSLQSCPTLCDPIDGSPQAPLSLGFSREEQWSGLPFPSPVHESEK